MKEFYSPKDVMEALSVSPSEANRIMHMFEARGQLFRKGRLLRVRKSDFDKWTKEVVKANNARIRREEAALAAATEKKIATLTRH